MLNNSLVLCTDDECRISWDGGPRAISLMVRFESCGRRLFVAVPGEGRESVRWRVVCRLTEYGD